MLQRTSLLQRCRALAGVCSRAAAITESPLLRHWTCAAESDSYRSRPEGEAVSGQSSEREGLSQESFPTSQHPQEHHYQQQVAREQQQTVQQAANHHQQHHHHEQQERQEERQQQQQQQWQSTVNRKEAEKFAKFSREWWAAEGPFKPLHRMNPVRVRFIADALCDNYRLDPRQAQPLRGLRLLDIGCGGGILSEGLARLGARMVGVDVNEAAVGAAAAHAEQDQAVAELVTYRVGTAEEMAQEGDLYDAVIASEVIEHVRSLPHFCASLARLTKPGGAVIVTTLNRTPRSFALGVVAAEYILRWVPAGTHDWSKFLTPEELCMAVGEASGGSLRLEQAAGMLFNPLTGGWSLGTDLGMNYAAYFRKEL